MKINNGSERRNQKAKNFGALVSTLRTRSLIHKAHLHIWRKFWKFSLLKYTQINVIKLRWLFLNAEPKLGKQTGNENITWKYIFCMLFWSLKFGYNLRISLSEHCEWGPSSLIMLLLIFAPRMATSCYRDCPNCLEQTERSKTEPFEKNFKAIRQSDGILCLGLCWWPIDWSYLCWQCLLAQSG